MHQLAVLRRQRPGHNQLFSIDRLIWAIIYLAHPAGKSMVRATGGPVNALSRKRSIEGASCAV